MESKFKNFEKYRLQSSGDVKGGTTALEGLIGKIAEITHHAAVRSVAVGAAFYAGVAVGTAIYNEFDTQIADAIDSVVGD